MKVLSFNINSLRARPHQMAAIVESIAPDVIALQETKVHDDQFPIEMIHGLGYEAYYHGQKTHYGVATLVKQSLVDQNPNIEASVIKGFAAEAEDHQRRFIGLEVNGIHILNGYFPQGESRDHPTKFAAKQNFYANLSALLENHFSKDQDVILLGDLNVAPLDIDIGIGEKNAKRWLKTGKTSFLPEEREWFAKFEAWGLTDVFRHFYPQLEEAMSWFDYRSRGFEQDPKHGLRIDHILVSDSILARSRSTQIDYDIRGMEKPSDHCPIWFEFDDE